jgi:dsDNA-specific endonuclease/ATPase MutS2
MITLCSWIGLRKYRPTSSVRQQDRGATKYRCGLRYYKRRLNFKSDIDIRGYRADEAIEAAQDLIDDALMLGISRVRILHGKGNGILSQVIRDYLRNAPGLNPMPMSILSLVALE